MRIGGAGAAPVIPPPALDAAALTQAVVGAVTGDLADPAALTKAILADPAAGGAPAPTAEDIAALQAALGIATSSSTRSGASAAAG